jgi:hypothetical protein
MMRNHTSSSSRARCTVSAAIAAAVLGLAMVMPAAAGESAPLRSGAVPAFPADWPQTLALLREAATRWPVLVVGFALALAMPVLALLAAVARLVVRRRSVRAALAATEARRRAVPPPRRGFEAWLAIEGGDARAVPLRQELLRIGGDAESDLRLPGAEARSAAALIRRTSDAEFVAIDLGGLTVNGQQCASAALADGDRLEIAGTCLTFRRPTSAADPAAAGLALSV